MQCSYPARIFGPAGDGEAGREARAVLVNMSASGFYLHAKSPFRPGERLRVEVRLSTASLDESQTPRIIAHGRVRRVEVKPDGAYGLALELTRHSFP